MTGHDQAMAGGRKHATLQAFFHLPSYQILIYYSPHESQQYHSVNEHNVLHATRSKI